MGRLAQEGNLMGSYGTLDRAHCGGRLCGYGGQIDPWGLLGGWRRLAVHRRLLGGVLRLVVRLRRRELVARWRTGGSRRGVLGILGDRGGVLGGMGWRGGRGGTVI